VRFDVITQPDARNRWHWEVVGPFPAPGGEPRIRETCTPVGEACPGFGTEQAARQSGQARVDEVAGSLGDDLAAIRRHLVAKAGA
jgi:hypothetical protein